MNVDGIREELSSSDGEQVKVSDQAIKINGKGRKNIDKNCLWGWKVPNFGMMKNFDLFFVKIFR